MFDEMRKPILGIATAAFLSMLSNSALAFGLFDGTPKWGGSTLGTGATITWSLIPDGTDVLRTADLPSLPPGTNEFLFQDFWTGPSDLASVYSQLDADPLVGEALFRTALTNAFNTWSAVTDLNFVEVTDSGLQLAHPEATGVNAGDIRIGAFPASGFFDSVAAWGFEPPGGTAFVTGYNPTVAGDLSLNKAALFGVAPGLEGEAFDFSQGFFNDIEGLLLHEIGHALGLTHPAGLTADELASVMYVGPGCCDNIHRTLGADDIAGIQALYGVRPVPLPATVWMFASAIMALGVLGRRRAV